MFAKADEIHLKHKSKDVLTAHYAPDAEIIAPTYAARYVVNNDSRARTYLVALWRDPQGTRWVKCTCEARNHGCKHSVQAMIEHGWIEGD